MKNKSYIYIFKQKGMSPTQNRVSLSKAGFTFSAIAVNDVAEAVQEAKIAVNQGVQFIELCGAFKNKDVQRIKESINNLVPVGAVHYA